MSVFPWWLEHGDRRRGERRRTRPAPREGWKLSAAVAAWTLLVLVIGVALGEFVR